MGNNTIPLTYFLIMRRLITDDMFHISTRLKDIDRDYFIMYNTLTNKYEIHNYKNAPNTYSLTIPYSTLDINTIYYVHKTHISNIDNIIDEIDKNNKNILDSINNNIQDMVTYKGNEIYKYADNTTKEFRSNSSYKNEWF